MFSEAQANDKVEKSSLRFFLFQVIEMANKLE